MANSKTTLTASNIKYLLVIYDLCKASGETRCVRIAEVLGLSKPSVHTMIGTLKDMELVHKDLYGTVTFTETGKELAEQYTKYFEQISSWFEAILPNSADIRPAVCAVMSEMSAELLEEMCRKITEQEINDVS